MKLQNFYKNKQRKKESNMTPESKQELIESLQGVIDTLKNMDEDQHFGLLLACAIQKEKGGDDFETANFLVGNQYVITNNLADEINEDEDYQRLWFDILKHLN